MVILAAVGEHDSNVPIIETAHDLAMAYEDELQVLHVIPDEDSGSHFQRLQRTATFSNDDFSVSSEQAETVAERLIEAATTRADSCARRPPPARFRVAGARGDPTTVPAASAGFRGRWCVPRRSPRRAARPRCRAR